MNKIDKRHLLIIFAVILFIVPLLSSNKWWQREIPTPSANQIVNPDYLNKKREMEQLYDNIMENANFRKILIQRGHSTENIEEYIEHLAKILNQYEYELSNIPMYLNSESSHNEFGSSIPPKSSSQNQSNIESQIRTPAIAGEGQVTIVYYNYIPSTVHYPEPAKSGGGIKEYYCIIYPESLINKVREAKLRGVQGILSEEYWLQGTQDDESNVINTLKNGYPVIFGLWKPDAITIKVPTGHYYLDYWIKLNHASVWGDDIIGPYSYGKSDYDWGPLEFQVHPNSVVKINVTPYGENFNPTYVGYDIGYTGILNLINYGYRLGP